MANVRRRKKSGVYYLRARLPSRDNNGSLVWKWRELSAACYTKSEAQKKSKEIEAKWHATATVDQTNDGSNVTFAQAAKLYVRNEGDPRFLDRIVEQIGELPLAQINQSVAQKAVEVLYPSAKVSTINRQFFTPLLAVMNVAARSDLCAFPKIQRPKGHTRIKPVETPDVEWFAKLFPELSATMRALVLFLTLHGRRLSEGLQRKPSDVDTTEWPWTLHIPETKTDQPILVTLSEPVIAAIQTIPNWQDQDWLFGTSSRSNVYRSLRKACARAGIPYFSTHPLGRHSFTIRNLRRGRSIKWIMSAVGWSNAQMPTKRYGHFERSEVAEDVSAAARETVSNWELNGAKRRRPPKSRQSTE